MKKTKIIATVGPVTQSKEKLLEIYNAWVNIIRFNFSHADHENASKILENIFELNDSWKTNLSILLDTKGPEIRTWKIEQKISYTQWDVFKIYTNQEKIDSLNSMFCDYPYLIDDLNIWDIIKIDSWLFDVKVIEKNENYLLVKALNSALIWSLRHINLPWIKIKLPWITQKDKEDILFWIKKKFNFIAASFVRSKDNVFEIREFLKQNNASQIKIISKIENQEWLDNLDEIIEFSDWIMVARWDLWIEIPFAKLPIYQKMIIEKCQKAWKFVIVATHMLETMVESPFPTRAEVIDISNSVYQKTDATMLSAETTVWKYPIKAVEIMTQVILESEKMIEYTHSDFSSKWLNHRDIEKMLLIKSAIEIWEKLNAKAIVIFTKSWLLARLASAFRPNIPIFWFTNNKSTLYFMNVLFWIKPIYLEYWNYPDWIIETSIKELFEKWIVNKDDLIISVADILKNWKEFPIMEIINISDYL